MKLALLYANARLAAGHLPIDAQFVEERADLARLAMVARAVERADGCVGRRLEIASILGLSRGVLGDEGAGDAVLARSHAVAVEARLAQRGEGGVHFGRQAEQVVSRPERWRSRCMPGNWGLERG
jgi:hypothetical protein